MDHTVCPRTYQLKSDLVTDTQKPQMGSHSRIHAVCSPSELCKFAKPKGEQIADSQRRNIHLVKLGPDRSGPSALKSLSSSISKALL